MKERDNAEKFDNETSKDNYLVEKKKNVEQLPDIIAFVLFRDKFFYCFHVCTLFILLKII